MASLSHSPASAAHTATKGPDGSFDIVPLDAPYTDFTFAVGDKEGKTTLTLDAGQEKYVFERAQ